MDELSDVRIIAIDGKRPPVIKKRPYIELFFTLSHQAPKSWCEDFNSLLLKHQSKPKIRADEGIFIETWVRKAEDVAEHLELLKKSVSACNQRYIARLTELQGTAKGEGERSATGEQARLNEIIAELVFDD